MSQENLEIVKRGWAGWERGDLLAALADIDPEEFVATRIAPMPDVMPYHGADGLLQMLADWVEPFDQFSMTGVEFTHMNDEQVIVRVHQHAIGTHSRVPIEADFWFVNTLRDGKIVRWDIYGSDTQALEAVGLEE